MESKAVGPGRKKDTETERDKKATYHRKTTPWSLLEFTRNEPNMLCS
jgi:hypothetical protein